MNLILSAYPELSFLNAIGVDLRRIKPDQLLGVEALDIRGTGNTSTVMHPPTSRNFLNFESRNFKQERIS